MVYGLYALSPVSGLSSHRRRRNCFRQPNPSVAGSGPHDFAARLRRRSSCDTNASTASHPALMTLRNAPPKEQDGRTLSQIPIFGKHIFRPGLEIQFSLIPLTKVAFRRRRFRAVEGRTSEMNRCELTKLICPRANQPVCGGLASAGDLTLYAPSLELRNDRDANVRRR